MDQHGRDVRFVPKADQVQCSKKECYSIAASASPKRPNYFADPVKSHADFDTNRE